MLLVILAAWYGYKKARDTGRNRFAWAAASAGVYIGIQVLVAGGYGFLVGMGQELWGWDGAAFEKYSIFVSILAIVLSFTGLLLVFRYLDRVPSNGPHSSPPPPPTFDQYDNS